MARIHDMVNRLPGAAYHYPIPFVALGGLIIGGVATWILGVPKIGNDLWKVSLVVGGVPIVLKTIRDMFHGRFAADVIAMCAILAAILFDEAFAGTVIVLMQSGGEALEAYGLGRASSALSALASRAPRLATRKHDGATEVISVEAVRVGDTLLVKKGDLVPVDGKVNAGTAEVDESALTGEPLTRTKELGDGLLSGSVNTGAAFEMVATKVSGESQYAKVVELVRNAQGKKPRIQRLADSYAVWFTPLTLAVAVFGVLLTSDPKTLLSVLVVATPCPLILATPIAVISGVNRAASDGIIVKSGAALEQLADTKVVVFDKTGTLTYGVPSVEQIIPLGPLDQDELLLLSASLEQLSSHPMAASLAALGRERFGPLPAPSEYREEPSRGIIGRVNSRQVAVGLRAFIESRTGARFPDDHEIRSSQPVVKGKLISYISVDGAPGGLIVFTDQVRPEVPAMVERLRTLGVREIAMLTGDNQENAELVSHQAGISSFHANLLPEGKVAEIERLKSVYGTTLMVGDGINDAPALATATVGMAMGAKGTAISAEAADIVLLVDDVGRVPEAVETGRKMDRVARQGIYFGLGTSILLMGIATFGFIEPAIGAIAQEVIDFAVIFNALRVR
ncbi:MAG TPA: heavy metal translocating P-type ATPase [Nitrososphaerales archaeon]|nr:heavy metal translocating P-type ATPase [Nitrososphaerales archaeon]